MSARDVECVRQAFSAFNRGDFEAAAELLHPDAEWVTYLAELHGSVVRGRAAIVDMWKDINENLGGSFRGELEEIIDCGDQVVAVLQARGSGTGSGAEVRQRWAQLASFRDGLIVRVEPFATREEALAAARRRA